MSEKTEQVVTTPDTQTAIVAAFARMNDVAPSATMIDRISEEDWSSDAIWDGNIECGSAESDPNELDNADQTDANAA